MENEKITFAQKMAELDRQMKDGAKTAAQLARSAMEEVNLARNVENKIYSLQELSDFENARQERERNAAVCTNALSKISFANSDKATHVNAGQLRFGFLRGVPHTVILPLLGFLAGLVIGLLLMGAF